MSLWAGSTSFDNQPLLLLRLTLAEFLSADDARGRSYGVDCVVLRNGRFLNFPPVPKPLSSRAVAMRQRERERGTKIRVWDFANYRKGKRGRGVIRVFYCSEIDKKK